MGVTAPRSTRESRLPGGSGTRGRRRATAALVTLGLALAGCGVMDGDGPAPGDGPSPAETPMGAIDTFFEDLYGDQNRETANVEQMRMEELIAQCMAEQGFDYTPVDYSSQQDRFDEPDIAWGTLAFAKEYGYGITTDPWGSQQSDDPASDADQWVDPNQDYIDSMTETEQQAYWAALWGADQEYVEGEEYEWTWQDGGCSGWANHEVWGDLGTGGATDEFTDLMDEMDRMWQSVSADPRMAGTEAAWASCMADAGHTGYAKVGDPEQRFYEKVDPIYNEVYAALGENAGEADYQAAEKEVQSRLGALTGEEIALATADFTCRDSSGYTKVQSEINLETQQRFYDEHKAELEAWAESIRDSPANR